MSHCVNNFFKSHRHLMCTVQRFNWHWSFYWRYRCFKRWHTNLHSSIKEKELNCTLTWVWKGQKQKKPKKWEKGENANSRRFMNRKCNLNKVVAYKYMYVCMSASVCLYVVCAYACSVKCIEMQCLWKHRWINTTLLHCQCICTP